MLDMFSADENFVGLTFQFVFNLTGAVEWAVSENLVHTSHYANLFRTDWRWLVVKAGAGNIEKFCLPGNGEIGVVGKN